jgi:potassium uptake TrkH family protein
MARFPRLRGRQRTPSEYVVGTFAAAILIGTVLLWLPFSAQDGRATSWLTALFTTTSAICVTGLSVVDTGTHWSGIGQWIIVGQMQVGGLGIMTLSSLLIVLLSRQLGMRHRLVAASATGSLEPGQVKALVLGVGRLTLLTEAFVAAVLFLRFWISHGVDPGRAAYLAAFHAVAAFNNAGFALFSDSMAGFRHDEVLLAALSVAIIVGGIGFPVFVQVRLHRANVGAMDLHAKITLSTTAALIVFGWAAFAGFEWSNAATLGDLSTVDSLSNAAFQSISFRTAGFQSMDISDLRAPTVLLANTLMFIGAGSASTAGGIKVTTFAVLGWVRWAEVRGDADVVVFKRRIPTSTQRQAVTVALMAVGVVIGSTMLLLATSGFPLEDVLFETVSALGTVGATTGITPELNATSQLVVIALMFLGRVGPPTLFAALILRERQRLYRHPEERLLVG